VCRGGRDSRLRSMSGPFIDDARVAEAREIAGEVIEPVFDLIRRNTTISVERTVLRLFGMSDAGPGGIPLTNLMTDRLRPPGAQPRRGVLVRAGAAARGGQPARRGGADHRPAGEPARAAFRGDRGQPPGRGPTGGRGRGGRAEAAHRRARRSPARVPDEPAAAQVRHRRHRQHLRRRDQARAAAQSGRTSSPSSAAPPRSYVRTAPPPRATEAPTPPRRTSASCARPWTTRPAG
jgi:beta-lysine 5,6-aminomutase alpha subunit